MRVRRKYGNKPTAVDGILFASKKEAKCYQELRLLERAKKIEDLRVHERWPIHVNGVKICDYIDDFNYYDEGRRVIADAKGFKTPEYKLKKKLVFAIYGTHIKEL